MIVIMGSGNVGSLIGGLLTNSGQEVLMIGRSPHISTVQSQGLYITGVKDLHVFPKACVGIQEAECQLCDSSQPVDYIFITTKAQDTKVAAQEIKPYASERSIIVSMQNGIATEDIVKDVFPNNQILRGITSIGVTRPAPGFVTYTGTGRTIIGYNGSQELLYAKNIVKMLNNAQLSAKITDNIIGSVYTKAIVNCGLNPTAALNRVKNIEIYRQQQLRKEARILAEEAWQVARHMDIELTSTNPIRLMFDIARKTGDNTNSMLNDILNHKKTEIDFLNGRIVTQGALLGLETPMNSETYQKITTLEQSYASSTI